MWYSSAREVRSCFRRLVTSTRSSSFRKVALVQFRVSAHSQCQSLIVERANLRAGIISDRPLSEGSDKQSGQSLNDEDPGPTYKTSNDNQHQSHHLRFHKRGHPGSQLGLSCATPTQTVTRNMWGVTCATSKYHSMIVYSPGRPPMPFISAMPRARRPPKAPAAVAAEKKIAIRRPHS